MSSNQETMSEESCKNSSSYSSSRLLFTPIKL